MLPTAQQSLVFTQSTSLYWAFAPEGGVCEDHVGLVAAPLDVWMIFPLDVVPPTAQQLLAFGHVTP